MTSSPLLVIDHVNRRFADVIALRDVSLTIGRNEFFALLGPSGCGKTTLLRSLAGFEYPDSGAITLDGEDLLALAPERRPVNLMFQSYALFPHMSVERNIGYGLRQERLARTEITRRVDEVLETTGLTALAKRRPAQLSGGQRQRVALARAIVKRPRLLLLDEPLSALDRKVRAEMQIELKRLQHEVGITFVVVTHDQEEAMTMADRIAVMRDGMVVQIATPVELYQRPSDVFVADFIGTSNLIPGSVGPRGFDSIFGQLPLTASGGSEARWLVVRPENARLAPVESANLLGRVAGISYQGGRSLVAVDVPGLDKPFLVSVPGVAAVSDGVETGLSWSEAVAVPGDGSIE